MATGFTMIMAYPAIVQLVRNPIPLGFGRNVVEAANVQLPFMIMFLVFASITPSWQKYVIPTVIDVGIVLIILLIGAIVRWQKLHGRNLEEIYCLI
jgi:hypothetical protein